MRYLKYLPNTEKPPSRQALLDLALLLALLPHLFILKVPMLIYLLLSVIVIFKQKSSKGLILLTAVAGIAAIALSFFAEYNLASFSRLLVFISFLISLLIYAITLQRLSRKINFYLLISPALLLMLSFFFFNSITMLFYALSALFGLVLLLLWQRMQASLAEAVKVTVMLFTFSLPIVALLFMVFPRVSFKKAEFGFKGEHVKRTGHDGTMHLDSKALLIPSQKVVMEVAFQKEVPPDELLYFRGSALYVDKRTSWNTLPTSLRPKGSLSAQLLDTAGVIHYQVTLYPHRQKWLYMLDMPLYRPAKSSIDADLMTTSYERINEIRRYRGMSALQYSLQLDDSAIFAEESLEADPERDPVTARALHSIINEEDPDQLKADRLLSYFSSLELTYSLKPEPIDLAHPVDSFLHDSKVGYCVHFAAAFATAARLIGLPSRIITGFKAERSSAVNNYLVIKEANAHAWVELYIDQRGWVRYEPTSTALKAVASPDNILTTMQNLTAQEQSLFQKVWQQSNLYYMYAKYTIDTWILQYSRFKQLTLLKTLLEDTLFLLKFVGSFLLFTLLCIGLFIVAQKRKYRDPLLYKMDLLITLLRQKGISRGQGETMDALLHRAMALHPEYNVLERINELYHMARYSRHAGKETLDELAHKIETFIKSNK
ncbi:MAG: DUF3488 and transglutaminase-like domain-containing protein [Campylobacterota bacterium]|nr:DUF3488 and transglutaminase-like domain-containing protein [Campylobacterota bacterium]